MIRVTVCSLLFISVLSGCIYHKLDFGTRFRFTGKVIDHRTGEPIEKASVFFVDKGLDEHRSKTDEPIKISETNLNGEIEDTFEYWWGTTRGFLAKQPSGDFIILIKKEGYNASSLAYNKFKLAREGGILQVRLGNIYLDRH